LTASDSTQKTGRNAGAYIKVETRPANLIAALYDELPFPNIGPVQEVALDIGITAVDGDVELTGMVVKGYNGHQLLFEQRWPARIIRQRIGDDDLTIRTGTGIALRALHFMIHGYEPLTMVEATIVAKRILDGEAVHGIVQLPVDSPVQRTDLHFPLDGAWWAIQGSDWSDRHKSEVFSETFATDFVKLGRDNSFFRGDGMALEEHYSWDQPIYATAGGKVAYVCFDMPDLLPGTMPDPRMFRDDIRRTVGNAIAISHGNGEFSYYAHLQQASNQVNEGEVVRRGALIGRVGNSGQSQGPHLHFQMMDGPNPFFDQGLPMKFSHFSAGGQFYDKPMTIPTRMIVFGPEDREA